MLREWLRFGGTVGEFWELTPRELWLAIEARGWQLERERQLVLVQAWYGAALGRQKRLPPLKRLLQPPETRRLSAQERVERAQEFAELAGRFGGQEAGHGR